VSRDGNGLVLKASGASPTDSRPLTFICGELAYEVEADIEIDAGAERALASGKSLLPAGVRRIDGGFDRGDAVVIRSGNGRELGRGLIAYSRADADRIIGKKSGEIAHILGYDGRAELIHRDDMALSRT
jgi:glutamate 5-kinase